MCKVFYLLFLLAAVSLAAQNKTALIIANGNYNIFSKSSDAYAVVRNNGSTHPVGKKQPNELGILDMSGNAAEWCWDWAHSYKKGSVTDPAGPASATNRIYRGGHWAYQGTSCRIASLVLFFRPNYNIFTLGFRVVRTAK